MKTKMKALALALCAVMLVATTVFVTVAYLTSTTDTVTNTFTVGNVTITLDEAPVDEYGKVVEGDRRTKNTYKLIPGHSYTKDPTVHVAEGSENCWLFVKVDNGIANIEDSSSTIASQMATIGWTPVATGSNIYYYKEIVEAKEDVTVFNSFKLAGSADVSQYANAQITIVAYAIQSDGFNTAIDAWNAAPTWNN